MIDEIVASKGSVGREEGGGGEGGLNQHENDCLMRTRTGFSFILLGGVHGRKQEELLAVRGFQRQYEAPQ